MPKTVLTLAAALLLAAPAAVVLAPTASAAPLVANVTVASFDGTPLAATLFVPEGASAESPVPFVLMTHGWAGSRQTTPDGRVGALLDAGYGVLTWDSRGFGASGGQVMLDSPDFEVKDVSVLLDWLVANAPVATVDGDPLVGMTGGSYAGAIQLLVAAFDARVDVIAPEIAWNDLLQSLAPNGVPKMSWIQLLFYGGMGTSCQQGHDPARLRHGCQTELLAKWYAMVEATNSVPPEVQAELLHRSPRTYMDRIDVPTLLVQGFPDTLFDVDQAAANYAGIKANGAPVKLWIYDGGHVLPHESAGTNTQASRITGVVVNWMDCHLKRLAGCDTGPEVEWYSTDGAWRSADAWPVPQATRTLHAYETLLSPGFEQGQEGRGHVTLETATAPTVATGDARVTMTVFSTGPTIFYAGLAVKDASGKLVRVGQQAQPVRIEGTSLTNVVTVDLVSVSPVLRPGESLVLALQMLDPDFNAQRTPGIALVTRLDAAWQSGPA